LKKIDLDGKKSTLPKVKRPKEKKITKWKPRNLLFSLFRDVGPKSADKINEFIQVNKSDILDFLNDIFRK
jgi:hypothetical protein